MHADLIDFHTHTHAIAPRLPDLESLAPWGQWPAVEQQGDGAARITVGHRPYRLIDDRCWSADRRTADMDADGVAVQVVSPVPVTFCHDAPADGAAVLARAQNDFLAGLAARRPGRLRALDPRLAALGVAFGAGMPTETGIAAARLPGAVLRALDDRELAGAVGSGNARALMAQDLPV